MPLKNTTKNKKSIPKIENIKCLECERKFGVDIEYIGIITCPYCGCYIEG